MWGSNYHSTPMWGSAGRRWEPLSANVPRHSSKSHFKLVSQATCGAGTSDTSNLECFARQMNVHSQDPRNNIAALGRTRGRAYTEDVLSPLLKSAVNCRHVSRQKYYLTCLICLYLHNPLRHSDAWPEISIHIHTGNRFATYKQAIQVDRHSGACGLFLDRIRTAKFNPMQGPMIAAPRRPPRLPQTQCRQANLTYSYSSLTMR